MSEQITAVRKFNRFFTEHIGAFDKHFLKNDASFPERRVLYEVGLHEPVKACDIGYKLRMDRSNLSRIIASFEKAKKWVSRESDTSDGRIRRVRLTPQGKQAYEEQNSQQDEVVKHTLAALTPSQQSDLVQSLTMARLLLHESDKDPNQLLKDNETVVIRPAEAGEPAYIASRQAKLYKEALGWGVGLEKILVETVVGYLKHEHPGKEQFFVAELDCCIVGSTLVMQESEDTARIKMVYVESIARRRGIAKKLMQTALKFAADAGFKHVKLWTHTVLGEARSMYSALGFEMYEVETHSQFGVPVQGEMWRLSL